MSTWLIEIHTFTTSICVDRRVAAGRGPEIEAPTATHPQLRETITRHAKETTRNMGRLLLHGRDDTQRLDETLVRPTAHSDQTSDARFPLQSV